jgi:hypothetical protein
VADLDFSSVSFFQQRRKMMLIRVRFLEVFEAISIVFISLHARHVADTAMLASFGVTWQPMDPNIRSPTR